MVRHSFPGAGPQRRPRLPRKAGIQRLRDKGALLADEFDAAKERAEGLGDMVRAAEALPLAERRRYQSLLVVRRARHEPDQTRWLRGPAHTLRHLRRQDRRRLLQVHLHQRTSRWPVRLRRTRRYSSRMFTHHSNSALSSLAGQSGGSTRPSAHSSCTTPRPSRIRTVPSRWLPNDFTRVNPNTGTAPIFRTRRDAEITRRIYERHPVLVDRSGSEERRVWPVRYATMFHMTNDSHLFRTAAQLDAEGFYPVQSNRWKRGEELYLPLYQGRMIHQFDHRANSVRVNPESTHNPYLSEEVTGAQHADPNFLPQTQYWVPSGNVEAALPNSRGYVLAFRDIARPTDIRTMIAIAHPTSRSR